VGTVLELLNFLAKTFRQTVWLNTQPEQEWRYTSIVGVIRQVFPMFELTIDGLEKTDHHLMARQ
jgi:hypothetical protein